MWNVNSRSRLLIKLARGIDLHLKKFFRKYDVHKFYFTNRIVDHWNSLPNWVVLASNILAFKTKT